MANGETPLGGQQWQWTFDSGPTAGTTYEHSFRDDGTVTFHDAKEGKADPDAKGVRYAAYEIGPGMQLISYLSDHGFTLTVAMNRDSGKLHGFASNDKSWFPLTGTAKPV